MSNVLMNALNQKAIKTAEKDGTGFSSAKVDQFLVQDKEFRVGRSDKTGTAAYEDASDAFAQAAGRLRSIVNDLVAAETEVSTKAKTAISRVKDINAQLGDSLNRVNKLLGPDFETKLKQMERLAAALGQLAELEKAGQLKSVMAALGNGK